MNEIPTSLSATKRATFAITRPRLANMEGREAVGSGFMIHPDGFFLTALHVLDGADVAAAQLVLEQINDGEGDSEIARGELLHEWEEFDLALMKFDVRHRRGPDGAMNKTGLPHVPIRFDPVDEGAPVYSFGYPMPRDVPTGPDEQSAPSGSRGPQHAPRITSAIVSSTTWRRCLGDEGIPYALYVVDRPFLVGNSGGPVVLQETGEAFAVCFKTQTYEVEQAGEAPSLRLPSPFGLAVSMSNVADDLSDALGLRAQAG